VPESLRAVAADMRKRYRTGERWWEDSDWLAAHPIGTAGAGLIATDLATDSAANSAPEHGTSGDTTQEAA